MTVSLNTIRTNVSGTRLIGTDGSMINSTDRATALLAASGWYHSARLRLLNFDVSIHSDSLPVTKLIDELYAPTAIEGAATSALMIGATTYLGAPGYFAALDGEVLVRSTAPTVAFAHLLFEANQQAIDRSPGLVRLHASAVAHDGGVLAFPGPMGAGKSTLVAGLVLRGLRYLTDEVVALDPETGEICPYAKPISLGIAPAALGSVSWKPPSGSEAFLGSAGLVPASALGTSETERRPLGAIVMPRYVKGVGTTIDRVDAAEALGQLAAHTFHLDEPGTLATLAGLVGEIPTYTLTSGNLDGAVDAVLNVVDGLTVT